MPTLMKNGITISDEDLLALNHDLLNPEDWLQKAVDGKIAACRKRMIGQWVPILLIDATITSIPGDEDALIAFIVARPDYKNRIDRDTEGA